MRTFAIAALVGTVSAADLYSHTGLAQGAAAICSHTSCEVRAGHTVVHDWHADEANGDHHHCVSDLATATCECFCGDAQTMGSTSKLTHDALGNKMTATIRATQNAEPTDNHPEKITVNGAWSNYGDWSTCSATCGPGTQTKTRSCDGQAHGGADCSALDGGSATATQSCKVKECPINGAWSNYGSLSTCSATCGPGTQTKTRSCDGAAHGGDDTCATLDGGSATATQNCNNGPCRTCTEYPATRALYLGLQVEMSAGGFTYGQAGISKAACEAACESNDDCKQTVWVNNHCYPMKAASKVDSAGDNAAFTSFQCSSTPGRQCTTKTSTRSKYLGAQVQMTADGITYGQGGVTLEQCTLACEKAAACKQAVWYNNHCYPMNTASDEVEAGSNAGFTSVHCGAPTPPAKLVPLTDHTAITLTDANGRKLDWDGADGRVTTAPTKGQWIMKKCISGNCGTGALGSASQWTSASSAASPLKTCDVVAWFNTASGRVYDCAHGTCTSQPYPLPAGHWGSPYKIRQQGVACNVALNVNAEGVYFSRMYSGVFNDNYYLSCDGTTCGGTTDGTKTIFAIRA